MSPSALILVGILTPTSGILGSLVWPVLQRKLGWSNLRILVVLVLMASLIPVYGCLGFIVQGRASFGGLTTQEEMFGLAIYFGTCWHLRYHIYQKLFLLFLPLCSVMNAAWLLTPSL